MSEIEVRAGKRQSLMREVNNRIVDVLHASANAPALEILCECVDENCTEWLSVSAADYEAVRTESRCFFVVAEHVLPEVEHVVRSNGRWVVVEKVGEAGAVAAQFDDDRPSPSA